MMNPKAEFQFLDFTKAKPARPGRNSSFSAGPDPISNERAMAGAHNMGKRTVYVPHGDDCSCIPCRRALILEQRSMEPLTFRDKVHITLVTLSGLGILGLFLMAWMASR